MILVVNAGSSSLKLGLFEGASLVAEAQAEAIGTGGAADHATALALGLAEMGNPKLTAAAHRVVHGGVGLTKACRITAEVEEQVAALVPLAPLHNPAALAGIAGLRALQPDLPQYASFDTGFHATNPEVARRYAIPQAEHDAGIRRYGFHGISYASLVGILRDRGDLPKRLLACHLGNGASLCAILDGRSVATTMGYSPLDGLTMGTRAGGIDGNAVLALAALHGIDGAGALLNKRSGLLALGGSHDMRETSAAAREHFIYWAVRHAGSMVAAMGGLDAVAFTGGIGENDAGVREGIVAGLGFLGAAMDAEANGADAGVLHSGASRVAIWIVPAEEEAQIAQEALAVMEAEGRG
jgi:acetate kinase